MTLFHDIDKMVQAVIADDPDAVVIAQSLARSLQEANEGKFARLTYPNPASIRQKIGLSQSQFAKALGISANTLKSWEQGQRQPSGSAKVLLGLLNKHPELIDELTVR